MGERHGWAIGAVVFVAAGCQAIAGLSDLEVVDAAAGGGGATTTTTDATSSSTGADGGGGASSTASPATSAGGGGQGGAGDGGRGGQGGSGGEGGLGGAGGDGGAGGAGGAGGGTTASTGGGPCDELGDCLANEVCPVLLGEETCGPCDEPVECQACGYVAPFPDEPPPCPPFCSTCEADERCAFACDASAQEPCGGATIFLASGAMDFVLTCTDEGCDGKVVRCGTDQGPADAPRSGPHECRVRCTEAGSCAGLTLDCSGQSGRCVLECAPGACVGAEVVCGENECVACGQGNDAVDFDPPSEADACSVAQQAGCPPLP